MKRNILLQFDADEGVHDADLCAYVERAVAAYAGDPIRFKVDRTTVLARPMSLIWRNGKRHRRGDPQSE